MWNVPRKAFLVFAALLVILFILNTGANAITVSNVTNAAPMATTVWILWNVSSEANNTVEYSINPDLSDASFSSWDNNTNTPKIKLWSLQPNTKYYYRVWSYNTTNELDNVSSSIYNFTTQECVSYKLVNTTDTSITGIDHPIQEALDMICLDGGIVELNNGAFNISTHLRIRENNITFRGQGINNTTINQKNPEAHCLTIGKFDDPEAKSKELHDKVIKFEAFLEYIQEHPEEIIENTTIERMTITFAAPTGYIQGIGTVLAKSFKVSEVRVLGNAENNVPMAIYTGHSLYISISDCIFDGHGTTLLTGGGCYCVNFINNTITNNKGWTALNLNGIWPLSNDGTSIPRDGSGIWSHIVGNKVLGGGGTIYLYSSFSAEVAENIVDNTGSNHAGIKVSNCERDIKVHDNIISNFRNVPAALWIDTSTPVDTERVDIFNNLIYNSATNGIKVSTSIQGTIKQINIYSNTIAGCNGDGIANPEGLPVVVKNNIIVNNKGAGIRNVTNISYNDVWNNTGGNYVDCNPGYNDISSDPLFADPDNGDFHLKSTAGRWNGTGWVNDNETSPCIDAGDPEANYSNEPKPNGGRINIGAYGNTTEASKSPHYGTVSGNVTDKDTGLPIEGALVSTIGYSNITDANGSYLITLPVGNYTLTASKLGYHSNSTTVQVLENQTTTANFQLTEETGLVGYWKFDEGSGSIAYDSSGNNNNGTIHGANWTTGKIGNALHFDGDNNYVDCGNDTSLNITNAITIAMWIKTTQNDQGWMIAKYGFDNIGGYGLCIHDGKLQFTTKVGDTWDDYQSDQSINDGVWHHVAGVFNGSTKVLYIDGNLDKSKPYSGSLVPNSDPLFIGKSTTEWPNPFSGSIDEGYIYKRGLTPEEIQELYQAGLFGIITGNVTDKDTGQPIIGATVTTDGYSNTTNNTGGYIITIPIGNYTVTASKTGYHSNSTTAQVFENQTTVVDFILSRHKRKLPVAKPVCATGIAILIVVVYWRYRRRRRRMRSGGFIVLVPGVAVEWSSFLYN